MIKLWRRNSKRPFYQITPEDRMIIMKYARKQGIYSVRELAEAMNTTEAPLGFKLRGINCFKKEEIQALSVAIRYRVIELLTNNDEEANSLYGSAWNDKFLTKGKQNE